MGRRNILKAYQVFNDADTSASPVGEKTDVSGIDLITYKIKASSLVNCELAVNVSQDDDKNGSYIALDFGESLIINGASETDYVLRIENHGFKWLSLDVISNTGTGTLNAWISGTSVGA